MRALRIRTTVFIFGGLGPFEIRAERNTQTLAGPDNTPPPLSYGFFDQFNGLSAILRADHSPLSPQIACAFFDKISSAAASARTFSWRRIALSFTRLSALSSATAWVSSFSLLRNGSAGTMSSLALIHELNSLSSSRVMPCERQN